MDANIDSVYAPLLDEQSAAGGTIRLGEQSSDFQASIFQVSM